MVADVLEVMETLGLSDPKTEGEGDVGSGHQGDGDARSSVVVVREYVQQGEKHKGWQDVVASSPGKNPKGGRKWRIRWSKPRKTLDSETPVRWIRRLEAKGMPDLDTAKEGDAGSSVPSLWKKHRRLPLPLGSLSDRGNGRWNGAWERESWGPHGQCSGTTGERR